jgi:hypothetical protein
MAERAPSVGIVASRLAVRRRPLRERLDCDPARAWTAYERDAERRRSVSLLVLYDVQRFAYAARDVGVVLDLRGAVRDSD